MINKENFKHNEYERLILSLIDDFKGTLDLYDLKLYLPVLGLWESMQNPDFKPIEFDRFRNEAGSNAFTLSPQKWIEKTNAMRGLLLCSYVT